MHRVGHHGPIEFEGLGLCFYQIVAKRAPKKNEFFLSGAIVQGYRARNDMVTIIYQIVIPTHHAKAYTAYHRGDEVKMTPGGIPLPRHVEWSRDAV